jgi:hypothetical protein
MRRSVSILEQVIDILRRLHYIVYKNSQNSLHSLLPFCRKRRYPSNKSSHGLFQEATVSLGENIIIVWLESQPALMRQADLFVAVFSFFFVDVNLLVATSS